MATSRDYYDDQPPRSPRPARTRRAPTYLEDFVYSYPPHQNIPPVLMESNQARTEIFPHHQVMRTTSTPAISVSRDDESGWYHLQTRFERLAGEMRDLQVQMDSVRRGSYEKSSSQHYENPSPLPFNPDRHSESALTPSHISVLHRLSPDKPSELIQPPSQLAQQVDNQQNAGISSALPPMQLTRPASVPMYVPVPHPAVPPRQISRSCSMPQMPSQVKLQPQPQFHATQSLLWPPTVPYALHTPPVQQVQQPSVVQCCQPDTQTTYYSPPPQRPFLQVPPPQSSYFMPQYVPSQTRGYQAPVQTSALNPYPNQPTMPGLMEMAITASYGIPKPKLLPFSSGKESDFLILKKGLDSILGPHSHLTEDYKYQVLLDHLKLPTAYQVAKRFVNSPMPYTHSMQALQQRYGQPRHLVQSELKEILNAPTVKPGDAQGFEDFAAAVNTLVGMLSTLDGPARSELQCGSHVDTLLTKLPVSYRDSFIEHCLAQGILMSGTTHTYTLPDFAQWLEKKSQAIQISRRVSETVHVEPSRREPRQTRPQKFKTTTILLGNKDDTKADMRSSVIPSCASAPVNTKRRERFKPFCPYCNNQDHYLSACAEFAKLSQSERANWINEKERCWRCGRGHKFDKCTLKKPCSSCGGQHLDILHDIATTKTPSVLTLSTSHRTIYMDKASHSGRVMLKVVPIQLHNGKLTLNTFAVLDDGSEKTVILEAAVKHLGLKGTDEVLTLRTIRQDIVQLQGTAVSFEVSALSKPKVKFPIVHAFSASELNLAQQSCPADILKQKYGHLKGIPLKAFSEVQPMVLIGSDHPHLITPVSPVHLGPPGAPVATHTLLGWTVQGPTTFLHHPQGESSCLHTMFLSPSQALHQHVERLWQLDTLPFQSVRDVTRSKQDQRAMEMLEEKTVCVLVDGVSRYATPLLRRKNAAHLQAPPTAVMALLRSTERRLSRNPEQATAYNAEITKLENAGYAVKVTVDEANKSPESWYIPHHMVYHNGKARVVFNCSYCYQQACLNDDLLPGPTLGPSLLGVLLRFREHAVAISGDIKAMFHQVRLLPEDQPLLRFLWRNMERERSPDIYEWRVLPFGTTCSPCCAVYALQRYVRDHIAGNEDVMESVLRAFYVDNCLQSFYTANTAKGFIDKLRAFLAVGGFEIRQWASNIPEVIAHLPTEARSQDCELWLTEDKGDPQESTLGLKWHCVSDTIGYKQRAMCDKAPTMRNVYRTLASQYDPLGFIIPYTTRAKVLIQALWKKDRGWDTPIEGKLLSLWQTWEDELPNLQEISFPRCYFPICVNSLSTAVDLHIFCDASEEAYGSVAYLRVEDEQRHIHMSFVMARSRVAPKRQLSMPRLELCAALTGAQLAQVLQTELSLNLRQTILWSDSTIVLSWIKSESCQYKVFVGTRILEIQDLVGADNWRYVDSNNNPADDITRGRKLLELSVPCRWRDGPSFLLQSPNQWPACPPLNFVEQEELRKTTFCGTISVIDNPELDLADYESWEKLVDAAYKTTHGAATPSMSAEARIQTEIAILRRAQTDSFSEELKALQQQKAVPTNSRLRTLSPVYDQSLGVIRVGGRLRKAETLGMDEIHPIVLDPSHPVTKLLIKDFDHRLLHAGPDRVFSELRRTYWILRGRQAVKKHQRKCTECVRWRQKPTVPRMADLPSARLRLFKPPFWSTGVDCFGLYHIKIGRRQEKRWGIVFKCLTTRCVHLDLLCNMDTDSFLLALRRFVARRGKPYELLCDQGTNFRGGERELQEAFTSLTPELQEQLAKQNIDFKFNPPHAPHFGGAWEREIKSIKASLQVVLKDLILPEEVLRTVLIEVEGIMNSKPLGYVSSDISDPDPITPNLLLMGRRDASLPQAVYGPSDLLGRRRYRHSQVIADHFWSQFIRKYLPSLQLRHKWQSSSPNLATGQVVMVVDPQLPRALWPVGRVARIITSDDGNVRTAEVNIKDRTYTRPVAKLVVLPELTDNDDSS